MNKISLLKPEVAKRIAAGEVIDRPAAVLRELLDNAIDAGAKNISVEIEEGGIDLLRITDDGSGMGKEDLLLAIQAHATSKLSSIDDLLSLLTLGFRGEALASIAAVAYIEIISAEEDGQAWRLESWPGKQAVIKPCAGVKGTSITVKQLFADFPARKRFLKKASAEAALLRTVFTDKACAWPDIFFRLNSNKRPILILSPGSLKNRLLSAMIPDLPDELFRELQTSGHGFKAKLIAGLSAVYRNDRRHIHVYINGRRVQEYAISQALEYAYKGILPGGAWPYIYAFLNVDPDLVDFNIHPAKKEVRLRNIEDIRGALIDCVRSYFGNQSRLQNYTTTDSMFSTTLSVGSASWADIADAAKKIREEGSASPWKNTLSKEIYANEQNKSAYEIFVNNPYSFKYIGQAFGVFLLFEQDDELFFLDQHAAHERSIYNELNSGKVIYQELLVPVVYEAESIEEDARLKSLVEPLLSLGFKLQKEGSSWLLLTAPSLVPEAMTGFIFKMIKENPDISELTDKIMSQTACKSAIKEGDSIDDLSAKALIKTALAFPVPFCPHGRPIFTKISKDTLYKLVKRIV